LHEKPKTQGIPIEIVYTIKKIDQGEAMGKKVLVAEDEQKIGNLLKLYLERESYQVELTSNGNDALEKAVSEPFDLIILDILMPGMDGFTVLENVRKKLATPVIMLSAKGEAQDLKRGQDLGADAYILKPFSPRDVISQIKVLLN
jgi:DNA-binding response OmpR family regulator